jgi:hypothetical protein
VQVPGPPTALTSVWRATHGDRTPGLADHLPRHINGHDCLRVFLVDHRGGWCHYLGHTPTDDQNLTSRANKDRVIALMNAHSTIIRPGQSLVVDLVGRVRQLWWTHDLLPHAPEAETTG